MSIESMLPPTISSSVPLSPPALSFSQLRVFSMSQFFDSGGQSIGVSASASVLPMNGLVGSPCSPRDSQESSPTLPSSNTGSCRDMGDGAAWQESGPAGWGFRTGSGQRMKWEGLCFLGNDWLPSAIHALAQRSFWAAVNRGEFIVLVKWSESLRGRRELDRRSQGRWRQVSSPWVQWGTRGPWSVPSAVCSLDTRPCAGQSAAVSSLNLRPRSVPSALGQASTLPAPWAPCPLSEYCGACDSEMI